MAKLKVLIGPSSFGALDPTPVKKLELEGFEVVDNPFKRKLTKDELLKLLPGVTALIAGLETIDREVLGKSDLKMISRCGAGMSNVDLEAAKELGIAVKNTPTAPVTAVAEFTIGCLLSLMRHVCSMDQSLHNGKWDKRIGRLLQGKTVAVIGFGNIGKQVAKLLRAFEAKVIAVDPLFSGKVDYVQLLELRPALQQADIISLHCSGEACLLAKPEFDLMKQGVFVLNAARGSLVNEADLVEALKNGKVAGAWLDTFPKEPYQGELTKFDQVMLTPHVSSYALECRQNMEMETVNNLLSYFNEKV